MGIFRYIWGEYKAGWIELGHTIGWVNTRIFLTALYIVVLALYALPKKLFDMLRRAPSPASSWQAYPEQKRELDDLHNPF